MPQSPSEGLRHHCRVPSSTVKWPRALVELPGDRGCSTWSQKLRSSRVGWRPAEELCLALGQMPERAWTNPSLCQSLLPTGNSFWVTEMPGIADLGVCVVCWTHDFTVRASELLPSDPFPLDCLPAFFPPLSGPPFQPCCPADGVGLEPQRAPRRGVGAWLQTVASGNTEPGCPGVGHLCFACSAQAWGHGPAPHCCLCRRVERCRRACLCSAGAAVALG